jgi:CBS domain-containing protein
MKVSDILSCRGDVVVSVGGNETVRRIVQTLRYQNIGAVIVNGDTGCLDGIATERDVARGLAKHGRKLLDLPASVIATTAIVSCSPSDRLTDVARLMTERHLWYIPVKLRRRLVDVISFSEIMDRQLAARRYATNMFCAGFAASGGSHTAEEVLATR